MIPRVPFSVPFYFVPSSLSYNTFLFAINGIYGAVHLATTSCVQTL
jgi:hypothetical protein